MTGQYEGIGQWAATFACGERVTEGQVVRMSGSGEVTAAGNGETFCGVALMTARDGSACSAALGGLTTVAYTGDAPAVGWTVLTGNGSGGVRTAGDNDESRQVLVVDVDTAGQTVTMAL